MKRKLIAVSGGFDPIHKGHVRMIREAAKLGDVIVILNSDDKTRCVCKRWRSLQY